MIVVISDLHFEEEKSDFIADPGSGKSLGFTRNVNAKAFENFAREIAGYATENKVKRIDLVLAGDIFDIHRTSLWFKKESNPENVRPYVSCAKVASGSALEAVVVNILESTAQEKHVKEALEVFQRLVDRKYRVGDQELDLPDEVREVAIHYIPGNHDRLANATPKIRRKVRRLLAMGNSGATFPHDFRRDDPRILVRHGHEYDRFNFSADYNRRRTFDTPPDSEYDEPAIGDYATVDFASRLPTLFTKLYPEDEILKSDLLSDIYERLLEFDDVRPIQAVFPFLLSMKGPEDFKRLKQSMWPILRNVIRELLDEMHDDPNLQIMLKKADKSGPDLIDAVQTLLRTRFWRIPIFRQRDVEWFLKALEEVPRFGESQGAETMAKRELAISNGSARFIVAGHTHKPQVSLLDESLLHGEQYYIDTGTWRNVIMSAPSKDTFRFGRVKALTYVVIYGFDEDPGKLASPNGIAKRESFDFWSGYTQRYFV